MQGARKENASAASLFVSVVLVIDIHTAALNCLHVSSGNLKQQTVKRAVDGDVKLRNINHAACKLSLIKMNDPFPRLLFIMGLKEKTVINSQRFQQMFVTGEKRKHLA